MNKKLFIPIIVLLILFIAGYFMFIRGTDFSPKAYSCEAHSDCVFKRESCSCGMVCINKDYDPKPCFSGIVCEFLPIPMDEVCGCVDNTCQSSKELFVGYNNTKNQAIDSSLSDLEAAMGLCEQLHGEFILECYTEVAVNILSVDVSKAIKVCDTVANKYYSNLDVNPMYECYYAIALKIVEDNPDLAIELCEKVSTKPSCTGCISYREWCARDTAEKIAKKDLIKAFKACEIEGIEYDSNFCKFHAIETVEKEYKNNSEKVIEILVEQDICEMADFSDIGMGDHYRTQCYSLRDRIQSSECVIENPDPNGYLLKICKYLKEHQNSIIPNKNPEEYNIREIEEVQYQGKDLLKIYLDCCYGAGDIATIDKETGEVIGFSPGDI